MPSWNADQYLKFATERTHPCQDLIASIALENPRRIIDLGCGPGNSTAVLAQRWPEAEITGLDTSPDMIAAAQKSYPRQHWMQGDIATWTANPPMDLVFSNAALQWVPDHSALLPHLAKQVAPGGALAVQVPANIDAPAHSLMRELAESAQWKSRFPKKIREWFAHEPAFYYDALAPLAQRVDLWKTEYIHVMENTRAIVEWYRGTGLRPFLDTLSPTDQASFLADYETLLATAYPTQKDGHVLFPFLRLFLVAYI